MYNMNFIAYILSIKNSDRSEHVETLARKLVEKGFQSVEIIDAIYWKECDLVELLKNLNIEFRQSGSLSQSQIACFLTHRKSWEIISNKDQDPNTIHIVLEDDMDISPNFCIEDITKVYESLDKEKYDSIFLYKHPEQEPNAHNETNSHNEFLCKHYIQWGFCAYSISPCFAKELCNFVTYVENPVDNQIQTELFEKHKKDRIFYTKKNIFENLGFLGSYKYGNYHFKSHIWG